MHLLLDGRKSTVAAMNTKEVFNNIKKSTKFKQEPKQTEENMQSSKFQISDLHTFHLDDITHLLNIPDNVTVSDCNKSIDTTINNKQIFNKIKKNETFKFSIFEDEPKETEEKSSRFQNSDLCTFYFEDINHLLVIPDNDCRKSTVTDINNSCMFDKIKENKTFSSFEQELKQTEESTQTSKFQNSDLYTFHLEDITHLLDIPDNDNDQLDKIHNVWTNKQYNNSPMNMSKADLETDHQIETRFNENSNKEIEMHYTLFDIKGLEINLFVEKCNECNKMHKRINNKIISKCSTCLTHIYYQCILCKKEYKFLSGIYKHILKHKKESTSFISPRCQRCNQFFKGWNNLKEHLRYCKVEPHLKCAFCPKREKRRNSLRKHILRYHCFINPMELENLLNKIVKDSSELKKIAKQKLESKYGCNIFPGRDPFYVKAEATVKEPVQPSIPKNNHEQSFIQNSIISICNNCHQQTKATGKATKCRVCKSRLIYRCFICGMQTSYYNQVRLHVICQHKYKIYHCINNCKQSFAYLYDYRRHLKLCMRKRSVQVDTKAAHEDRKMCLPRWLYCKCGKTFTVKKSMELRVRFCKQADSLLFCDHCDFKADNKHKLRNHIMAKHGARLFRGIDAFRCTYCPSIFKNYFVYNRHVEICRRKKIQSR